MEVSIQVLLDPETVRQAHICIRDIPKGSDFWAVSLYFGTLRIDGEDPLKMAVTLRRLAEEIENALPTAGKNVS